MSMTIYVVMFITFYSTNMVICLMKKFNFGTYSFNKNNSHLQIIKQLYRKSQVVVKPNNV